MIAELGQQKAHPNSAGVRDSGRAVEHAHCAQDPGIRPLTTFSAKPDLMVLQERIEFDQIIHLSLFYKGKVRVPSSPV
jgi:hypothetical protein